MASLFRRLLDRRRAAKHDHIGQGYLLAARLRIIEGFLNAFERRQYLRQLGGLVNVPILLRRKTNARAIGTAPLVRATEGRGRRPCGRNQFGNRDARSQNLGFQRSDVLIIDELMGNRWDRILPKLGFGNLWAQQASDRPHIAMRELVPSARKHIGEFGRIFKEPTRNLLVGRIHPQREIRRQHHRSMPLRRIMRIRHGACGRAIFRRPLPSACWALRQLPIIIEEVFKVVVIPNRGVHRPSALEAARNRMRALAAFKRVLPAKALLFKACTFWLRSDIFRRIGCTMHLAEGVTTRDQRHGFLIVHRHTRKGLADVDGGSQWIGLAVRAFRVDVDQAHLHGGERVFELAIARIALVVEPGVFRAPINIFFGLPHIGATTGKAEGLKAHRFKRAIARQNHQIGP